MKPKTKDILILIFINILAIVVSTLLRTNFLISTILFFGLPSIYLLSKEKSYFKKVFIASISFGIFFGFVLDFIAELNQAWSWNGGLMFGKILGIVQIDVMIWLFLWIFHIFLFYEHFMDHQRSGPKISKREIWVLTISVLTAVLVVFVYKFFPSLLYFKKAYLTLGLTMYIPFMIIFFRKPKFVWKVAPMVVYFFFVYLSHEVVALHLDQWRFPGDYIGWVRMFGVSFPVEEFIFWIILSSLIGATYYELDFDNQKN